MEFRRLYADTWALHNSMFNLNFHHAFMELSFWKTPGFMPFLSCAMNGKALVAHEMAVSTKHLTFYSAEHIDV